MSFSIFLPERKQRMDPDPPVLYYLSGLTCTDENARTKAQFAQEAGRVGLAVVFPDTSTLFFHNFKYSIILLYYGVSSDLKFKPF